jgi:hypothetical protein
MFALLSPAKKLDETSELPTAYQQAQCTQPQYLGDSAQLIDILLQSSLSQIKKLMGLSAALAELNYQRFQSWQLDHQHDSARPAILMFDGDVYAGLQAQDFGKSDIAFAQQHLGILSGLYGLLRPLDRMQAYRLEMGTPLANTRGTDLYAFWRQTITDAVNQQLHQQKSKLLLNLASQEYFQVLQRDAIDADIVSPVFKDAKNGQYKIISFYAKKARGLMARYIIQQRIKRVEDLQGFDLNGYWFNAEESDAKTLMFYRDEPQSTARK